MKTILPFLAALLLTPLDVSQAVESPHPTVTNYPAFAWDTVQVWCPLRNSTQYTEDDISKMAAHKIVML